MTKELFVSSTPHETRVGMVEDDQLAEIYLERENEYTLAGSIYKGRVTRVLPGMQSAFVDIGLERDAFLYVSDFMELAEEQEEVDEVAAAQAVPERASAAVVSAAEPATARPEPQLHRPSESQATGRSDGQRENHAETRGNRGWRGRRRRGRRGERFPDSKYARPGSESQESPRQQYGPPPGYQPMILPGESISKYQRFAQAIQPSLVSEDNGQPLTQVFPEDEP